MTDGDNSQQYHIDLWTGFNIQDGSTTQVECENRLPGGQLTIIDGAPGLPVDSKAHSLTDYLLSYITDIDSG